MQDIQFLVKSTHGDLKLIASIVRKKRENDSSFFSMLQSDQKQDLQQQVADGVGESNIDPVSMQVVGGGENSSNIDPAQINIWMRPINDFLFDWENPSNIDSDQIEASINGQQFENDDDKCSDDKQNGQDISKAVFCGQNALNDLIVQMSAGFGSESKICSEIQSSNMKEINRNSYAISNCIKIPSKNDDQKRQIIENKVDICFTQANNKIKYEFVKFNAKQLQQLDFGCQDEQNEEKYEKQYQFYRLMIQEINDSDDISKPANGLSIHYDKILDQIQLLLEDNEYSSCSERDEYSSCSESDEYSSCSESDSSADLISYKCQIDSGVYRQCSEFSCLLLTFLFLGWIEDITIYSSRPRLKRFKFLDTPDA